MKHGVASLAVVTLMLAPSAFAATPKPMSLDDSANFLMDPAAAEKIWKDNTPARVIKLYPEL